MSNIQSINKTGCYQTEKTTSVYPISQSGNVSSELSFCSDDEFIKQNNDKPVKKDKFLPAKLAAGVSLLIYSVLGYAVPVLWNIDTKIIEFIFDGKKFDLKEVVKDTVKDRKSFIPDKYLIAGSAIVGILSYFDYKKLQEEKGVNNFKDFRKHIINGKE